MKVRAHPTEPQVYFNRMGKRIYAGIFFRDMEVEKLTEEDKIIKNIEIPLGHETIQQYTPFYHWSPSENHASIAQQGLRIRQKSLQGEVRLPYIAFSSTPMLAWTLSAMREMDYSYKEWDLWCVWDKALENYGWEVIGFDDGEPREFRVYHSIPPKKLWFVGSRNASE